MKFQSLIARFSAMALWIACAPPVSSDVSWEVLHRADTVFIGHVVQLNTVSFPEVPVGAETITVEVEQVVKKPEAVVLGPASLVTVAVKDPASVQPGMRATFYTEVWIAGQGIAVRELAHESAPAMLNGGKAEIDRLRREMRDAELSAAIAQTDRVILGKVVSVRAAPLAAEPDRRPITEHDPQWKEAVVRVESWIKGGGPDQIVVRFPDSLDVAWYQALKLRKGMEGVLLLEEDHVSGLPRPRLAGVDPTAYTALAQPALLPKSEANHIRALVQAQ
jgi:hypothetical protein